MTSIKIYDGKTNVEVEVTEEFAIKYAEIEYQEYKINRKETRRHQSLDKSLENGFDVIDTFADTFLIAARREQADKLYAAINLLAPEQQELLRQIYFEYIPQTEIALSQGVTKYAINKRLERILKKLRKILEYTVYF